MICDIFSKYSDTVKKTIHWIKYDSDCLTHAGYLTSAGQNKDNLKPE